MVEDVTAAEVREATDTPSVLRSYKVPTGLVQLVKVKAAQNGESVTDVVRRGLAAYLLDDDLL